jgi:hypothetical protein
MRDLRPAAILLLLTLTLGSPCLASARSTVPAASPRVAEQGDLLVELRAFLVNLWKAAGCRLDPWGRCVPDTQTVSPKLRTADAGYEIDPWGRCATGASAPRVPTVDAGCEIDPLGRCKNQP